MLPDHKKIKLYKSYKKLPKNFSYSSDKNYFLSIKEIKNKISKLGSFEFNAKD